MAQTATDLFRRGNASSPRLTNVRVGKDIITFQSHGVEWVAAGSGGVSTFAAPRGGGIWWVLPAGSEIPDNLSVVNDHGDHYNWEPAVDMPLADFVALLSDAELGFSRVT